ncbi:MAG: hypothetical protein AAGD09_14700 [Cyanobacteria bacterium P01_F01_bin.56]
MIERLIKRREPSGSERQKRPIEFLNFQTRWSEFRHESAALEFERGLPWHPAVSPSIHPLQHATIVLKSENF